MVTPGNIAYLYVMQRLTTLFVLFGVGFVLQAQTVNDYQPDSDGDGCITAADLIAFLSVFGNCGAQSWACGDVLSYQGYDYATVLIGDQCWFAENLRNENYENGDAIPSGLSDSEWDYTMTQATSSGAVAVFGEGNSTCEEFSPDWDACDEAWSLIEYGRLYNWYAVDDVRGLCPSGWHVPTDGEWMTMEMALGMSEAEASDTQYRGTDQGSQLKSVFGWFENGSGSNSSGFSSLPGGYRNGGGSFDYAGRIAYYWTSTSLNIFNNWYRSLSHNNEGIYRGSNSSRLGFSVRCIKDSE